MDTTAQSHEHQATLPPKGKTQTHLGIMVNCSKYRQVLPRTSTGGHFLYAHLKSKIWERDRERFAKYFYQYKEPTIWPKL